MNDGDTLDEDGTIRPVPFVDALAERYLAYAVSTIVARSLPDVRDGLKPVHRRVLYAMRELGLNPASGFKKSARVVGDVMGKYHPHGDQAIYDALVRLAQDFSSRYPLVDGQGNFGNVDGDNAAAMRYTEARMTAVAEALLEGIDEDAVDFRETYDGDGREPLVLPARFPNLLANGAQGIAVGMATSVPPHHVGELCRALKHLVQHPDASIADLMTHVRGPDFPTGGVLVEPHASLLEAYETGRGSMRLRASWRREEFSRGLWQVVVDEVPYQVQKSRLIERIALLIDQKKLPLVGDCRDESAAEVRIVIEPRTRSVDPVAMMEQLFRASDLEVRVSLNMNVLDGGRVPRVMSLKEVLRAFLDHRREVLQRRSAHRLAKIADRLEVLAGYLIVYANLDEVIRIIREADDARAELMAAFELTERQAQAILDMRLRALRKLEEIEIRREFTGLEKEQAGLQALLASERRQWTRITQELDATEAEFGEASPGGARKTAFEIPPEVAPAALEAAVEREPITVDLSRLGWLRALKGHVAPDSTLNYRDEDGERFRFHAETTDRLLVATARGRFFTIPADSLPGGRGGGQALRLIVDLAPDDEVVALLPARSGQRLVLAASDGYGFVAGVESCLAQTRTGRQVLNPAAGQRLAFVLPLAAHHDHLAVIGDNRRLLVFPLSELAELARGKGVRLQRYKDGGLADISAIALSDGLAWTQGDRTRRQTDLATWLGHRGSAGRLPPHGFPRNNRFDGGS